MYYLSLHCFTDLQCIKYVTTLNNYTKDVMKSTFIFWMTKQRPLKERRCAVLADRLISGTERQETHYDTMFV